MVCEYVVAFLFGHEFDLFLFVKPCFRIVLVLGGLGFASFLGPSSLSHCFLWTFLQFLDVLCSCRPACILDSVVI